MNHKNYIAFLGADSPSFWSSCTVIDKAFDEVILEIGKQKSVKTKSYQLATDKEPKFDLLSDFFPRAGEHSKIVVIRSHLLDFPTIVNTFFKQDPSIQFYVMVFGDISVEVKRWSKIQTFSSDLKIRFVAASRSYHTMISSLLLSPDVVTIPYPLEQNWFKSLTQSKSQFGFIYGGRVCSDKGIHLMLAAFAAIKKILPASNLIIAGKIFERNYHLHRKYIPIEELNLVIEKFKSIIGRDSFFMLGQLDQEMLKAEYDKQKYFISFSTYFDEDFGVSVAQAMARGCIPILTNWGGYRDFNCLLNLPGIPIELDENLIPKVDFVKYFKRIIQTLSSEMSPAEIQNLARDSYSPKAVAQKWLQLFEASEPRRFGGSSHFLAQLEKTYNETKGILFSNPEEIREVFNRMYADFY